MSIKEINLVFLLLFSSLGAEIFTISSDDLTVEFESDWGGAIYSIIYEPTGENLVDHHDVGRLLQVAYYDGRDPWVWDPVEGGGSCDSGSQTIDWYYFEGANGDPAGGVYVKTLPRDWKTCAFLPDTIEKWVEFVDDTILKIVYLAQNTEYDTFFHSASQETPCHYGLPNFKYYVLYGGFSPWSYSPVDIDTFPTNDFSDTVDIPWHLIMEHWIAQKETTDFSLTMFTISGADHGSAMKFPCDVHPTYAAINDLFQYSPGWRPVASVYVIVGSYINARNWIYEKRNQILSGRNYEFDSDSEGWLPEHDVSSFSFPESGILHFTTTGSDPYILSPPDQTIDTKKFKGIEVRMKTDGIGTLQIYFISEISREWNEQKKRETSIIGDGNWHTYYIDMSDCPFWDGFIYQFRVDPCNSSGASVDIDYIKTIDFTNYGWDFCGYDGGMRPANQIDTIALFPDSGFFRIVSSGNDPQIISTPDPGWMFSDFDSVKIRLRSDTDGEGRLYWMSLEFPLFYDSNSIPFSVIGDGLWHTYSLSTSGYSGWTGTVWEFRLDPIDQPNATVDIDYLYFIRDTSGVNISENTKSNAIEDLKIVQMGNAIKLSRPLMNDAIIKIFDLSGKIEKEIPVSTGKNLIKIPGELTAGLHLVEICTNNNSIYKGKIIVLH